MGRLTFVYATMGAGKSLVCLSAAQNLRLGGRSVELWTFGDRSGSRMITSRAGMSGEARAVAAGECLTAPLAALTATGVQCLVIDEVQFASAAQIDQLAWAADMENLDVRCFGLSTDFTSRLFEGSQRLFEIADTSEALPLESLCWCGRLGRINARVVDGHVERAGAQVVVGDVGTGAASYRVLCRPHWAAGEVGPTLDVDQAA